jgi:hypothetical protein
MMSEPLALIAVPFLTVLEPAFQAGGLSTARAWELTDDERGRVRSIVHAGEVALTAEFLQTLPGLGLIACVSVGYDGIDVAWCRANGIEVTHARGLNAEDVADHAIGLMLAAWRDIPANDRKVREGRWVQEERIGSQPSLGAAPWALSAWAISAPPSPVAPRSSACPCSGGHPGRRMRPGRGPRTCWRWHRRATFWWSAPAPKPPTVG